MSDMGSSPQAGDLFDRWLAHHEGRPFDAPDDTVAPDEVAIPDDAVAPDEVEEAAAEPAPAPAEMSPLPDQHLAAASVLAALQAPPEPEPTPEPAPQPDPAPAVPAPAAAGLPRTIFFKPRTGTRRFLGFVLLVWLLATVAALVWAWHDRTYLSYGLAATAAVVTGIVWAARAGAVPARLTLHGSELEIVRGGSRSLFDLAQSHTPIEVQGHPGQRRWRVFFLRRGMTPYVVDASMVDPTEFMRVLRFFRPEGNDRTA